MSEDLNFFNRIETLEQVAVSLINDTEDINDTKMIALIAFGFAFQSLVQGTPNPRKFKDTLLAALKESKLSQENYELVAKAMTQICDQLGQ